MFAVWEPVIPTDLRAPSTAALGRIADPRASQFWDKDRLLSHAMGEKDEDTIVWDHIAVYTRGALWEQAPPKPTYEGRPVVQVIEHARAAIARVLAN